jgi:site-specific DNA recombinase
VGYARVSTDKQASEGISLDAQAAKYRAYAIAHDVELVALEHDALSGKDTNRPGLLRALRMLERGEADGLLVAKLDRLTRDVGDFDDLLEEYFKRRFKLLSVADSIDTRTAAGRFFLHIQIGMAQWERETIGERTTDALAHKRATGGGTPRIEGDAAARILALHADGLSFRAIAKRLTDEGIPTRKRGKWAGETVRRVLARLQVGGGEVSAPARK